MLYREYKPDELKRLICISIESGGCPFENVRRLAERADVVVATYPFLINGALFSNLGTVDNIIIDEAHNLAALVTASMRRKDFDTSEELTKGARSLNRLAVALWREGRRKEAISVSQLADFIDAPGEVIKTKNFVIKTIPPVHLLVQRDTKKFIIQSATLFPEGLYRRVFVPSGESFRIIKFGNPLSGRTVFGLDIGASSAIALRADFPKVAATIVKAFSKEFDSVLAITPSYELAEAVGKLLGVPASRDKILPSNNIVITVARGRFAEGVDLSADWMEPQVALILGIPFPRPSEEIKACCIRLLEKTRP